MWCMFVNYPRIKLKELIDKETGEIIEVDQITKKYMDKRISGNYI